MDVFTTRDGRAGAIPITDRNFIRMTMGRRECERPNGRGGTSHFAVCPCCGDPIQLVGLFKREQEARDRKPYGRHWRGDVPGLARYDEEAYLHCIYSDPNHRSRNPLRAPADPAGRELYELMRDEFDHVARAWEDYSGIRLSPRFAERMLGLWRGNEGWRYYVATRLNLPQALFYGAGGQRLYGRWIKRDGALGAVLASSPGIGLEPVGGKRYMQVRSRDGRYLDLTFALYDHGIVTSGEHATESFALRVTRDGPRDPVADIRLDVDPNWLDHARASMRGGRDERLLEAARRILT